MADLGDGNGPQPEIKVMRQDYGSSDAGTCLESLIGGNHFRYWRQNGTLANTGALFLAYVSLTFSNINADSLLKRFKRRGKIFSYKYSTLLFSLSLLLIGCD